MPDKMAAGGLWAALPSVVLEEIFSMLSPKERILASSVCRRWRDFLFLPKFWSAVTFSLSYRGRPRTRFLSSKCGKFLKEAVIAFNSTRCSQVWDCSRLLELLSTNRHLECISLRPSNCYFDAGNESLQRLDIRCFPYGMLHLKSCFLIQCLCCLVLIFISCFYQQTSCYVDKFAISTIYL